MPSLDPYDFNCVHAAQAYELRRRGLDVTASGLPPAYLPSPSGAGGRPLSDVERVWGVRFTSADAAEVRRAFEVYGPGARGFVAVLWPFGGGHLFNAENVGGMVRFVDPQTAQRDVAHYLDLAERCAYARVDTATPGEGVAEFAVGGPS